MNLRFAPFAIAASAALLAAPAAADTLVDNVEGITLDAQGKVLRFKALVIDEDGRIVSVIKPGDKAPAGIEFRVDGKGSVMLPGMIDSHVHVMGIGFGALTLDLSETRSLAEAQAKIREYAAAHPDRPWILGRGWNQEKWGLGRFPTAAELDAIVPDRPVWLSRVDGHASWANSEAIKRAGVTAATQDPAGGRIIRKAGSRDPEGVFVDAAESFVNAVVPAPRPADR
ncbi:MAG: amidohydrolase family protein, partial [Erythrobacter sp.]